jgi:hypothetical protein
MRMGVNSYARRSGSSQALVIGINTYRHVSPLNFAVADAHSDVDLLRREFQFPRCNVHVLTNRKATKVAVLAKLVSFAARTAPDDRLIVYFAGHGHTRNAEGEMMWGPSFPMTKDRQPCITDSVG